MTLQIFLNQLDVKVGHLGVRGRECFVGLSLFLLVYDAGPPGEGGAGRPAGEGSGRFGLSQPAGSLLEQSGAHGTTWRQGKKNCEKIF